MSTTDPDSTRTDRPAENPTGYAGEPAFATRQLWLRAVTAGVVAGILAWSAVEGSLIAYRSALRPAMKPFPTPEDTSKTLRAQVDSGTVGFGAMGALFGLAFGVAGGSGRRSAVRAGLVGLVLGGVLTAGASWVILPVVYIRMDPQSNDLMIPLLCHSAVWSLAGTAGGLAFGLGLGGRNRWAATAVGGLFGAAAAAVVYELVGALAFATHRTHLPVASSPETRAMGQILVGLGTAIGAVLTAAPRPRPRRATSKDIQEEQRVQQGNSTNLDRESIP